ncbi:MAG: MFS transporter [Eubacteriales bacterium]
MKKNIITMNILVAFFWMSMYSYVPNLPKYAQSLGADSLVIGIIGGVYGIAQVILRIPIGLISDRTGRSRAMMLIGSVALTCSSGIFILANDTNMIILGRLIAGSAAAWWVIQSATYGNYHKEEMQVKAQGVLGASANWGRVVASLAGGLIAQFLGVHAIFIFSFAAAGVCIFLAARLKDIPRNEQKKPDAGTVREVLTLLRNRDMIVFSILGIISCLLFFAGPTYFTAVAAQKIGATSLDMGLLNMVFYIFSGVICLWIGSRGYKKLGNTNAMAIAFIITGISCIPYFYHFSLPVIYTMQAISGIGSGITATAIAGLVLRAFPIEKRGVATGIYQSLVALGAVIGPVMVGGIMKSVSFDMSYWSLVVVSVAGAMICYFLVPKKYAKM